MAREELSKYMNQFICNSCDGSRLKKEAMAVKTNKKQFLKFRVYQLKMLKLV